MGNILSTIVTYGQTDVYIFKDTNSIITSICRIKFMAVDSVPTTAAKHWVISSSVNALNPYKYDVTLEYHPFEGPLNDYALLPFNPVLTENLLLTSFVPVSFIVNSNTVIITPNAANPNFNVTIVDTSSIIVETEDFENAIYRVINTDTDIYGYVRNATGDDVAITEKETAPATNKNFDNKNRLEVSSIILTKGRWLLTGTGSFNCSQPTQVHFWFDFGGLLDELNSITQYKNSLQTFNSQSNSNMTITMHCELYLDDVKRIYWCCTPDENITSSIFSNTIPTPSITNPFVNYAMTNNGVNSAKITAISVSSI